VPYYETRAKEPRTKEDPIETRERAVYDTINRMVDELHRDLGVRPGNPLALCSAISKTKNPVWKATLLQPVDFDTLTRLSAEMFSKYRLRVTCNEPPVGCLKFDKIREILVHKVPTYSKPGLDNEAPACDANKMDDCHY
jgi:hypothetical protein